MCLKKIYKKSVKKILPQNIRTLWFFRNGSHRNLTNISTGTHGQVITLNQSKI